MSYGIVLEPNAAKDFRAVNRIAIELGDQVWDSLEDLAREPTVLSSRCDYPYPNGQFFEFSGRDDFDRYRFTVLFQFSQSEEELIVLQIGYFLD